MNFDLRIPVGLLFAIFGALLVIAGAVASPAAFQRSLGINVDLWWGVVLLAFGVVMLVLARRSRV